VSDIRWDLVTVGHLSRNKFWGESETRAHRRTLCTCTVIRGGDRTILIDPSLPAEQLIQALDERTGLPASAIDTVFVTHHHGDHRVGLAAFPAAQWFMAEREIRAWRADSSVQEQPVLDRIQPALGDLAPGVELLATPGHTLGHTSVVFDSAGARVAVTGDAVMTADFFRHRDYFFNTVNPDAAVRSLGAIGAAADIVIPGHDNYFLPGPAAATSGARPV
jgi:glyoxylase-like metal-dependent hydrolase (beta-lactamase superfamily II)